MFAISASLIDKVKGCKAVSDHLSECRSSRNLRAVRHSPITRPSADHRGSIVGQPERKSHEWFYPLHSALLFQAPPGLESAMSTTTLRNQRLAMDTSAPVGEVCLLSFSSSPIGQVNAGLSSTWKVFLFYTAH